MTQVEALHESIYAILAQVEDRSTDIVSAIDVLDCLYRMLIPIENKEDSGTNSDFLYDGPHFTLTDIAVLQDICVQGTKRPSISAICAILEHLKLEPHEWTRLDNGICLYDLSVVLKVGDWLSENGYPLTITSPTTGDSYNITYHLYNSEELLKND